MGIIDLAVDMRANWGYREGDARPPGMEDHSGRKQTSLERQIYKDMGLTAHHTPGRSSRIFSRTPFSWVRNQCPPIFSVLKTFSFEDFFQ